MRLIAITGGIGSGKSVVSRLVKVMGYEVYDCDSRAKALMTEDAMVRQQLTDTFGEDTYLADGSLNRAHLSAAAFSDPNALTRLNAIVHPATATDMICWADEQADVGATMAFVETALLRTAGLDRVVDEVWHVTAPDQVRIDRVIARSGLTAEQVKERMAAQRDEDAVADGEQILVNDNVTALLPQVVQLLDVRP
jgi:dephospho-CoA kinase